MIIKLSKGFVTEIDDIDSDLDKICHWSYGAKGYAKRGKDEKTIYLHIVILERKLGRSLKLGEKADHKDRNSLNNRRDNLRLATYSENRRNSKLNKNNKSGFRGVCRYNNNYWRAALTVNGITHQIGWGNTKEEVYEMYLSACEQYNVEVSDDEIKVKI